MTNLIMIGHGRKALTIQAIESLYANTDSEQFNMVFVSDQELDFRISKYLRSITKKNFMLLEVSSGSSHVLSQLKNIGAYASEQRWGRGDWLYFSDNDVWFSPIDPQFGKMTWLDRMTSMAETSEMDAGFRLWGGQIHPYHQPIKQIAVDMTEHSILDGPSWLMRWDTWDLCGPLDRTTAPGACQSEEYGFCERLLRAGICEVWKEFGHDMTMYKGARIGVIHPHVVIHTGLTQSDGREAPGAAERRLIIPQGVLAE